VKGLLADIREVFPGLVVDTYNIHKTEAMTLNEALCERFRIPDAVRLVTPSIFCAAGGLVKEDITFDRLGGLLAKSAGKQDESWLNVPELEIEDAKTAISDRYAGLGAGIVALAGLLDGVNPCAFATIIFFLSYLQVTHRRPREIVQVGAAFIVGVFLAYFFLGLGLVEVISRLTFLQRFGRVLNWAIAGFALVVAALSLRDGFLCLQGRIEDITLQLPGFLKTRIHGTIRHGARRAHFVVAAFVVGVVISLLELACTGQVYAPTILFMLKTSGPSWGPVSYLLLYNLAFVAPLVIIFALAFGGMQSDALTRFLRKRAAVVKFATAALFFLLFLFFALGSRIPLWNGA